MAPEDCVCYGFDAMNEQWIPDGVIFPGNAEEVSAILDLAGDAELPVVPRGAGSGYTGGALPVRGGLVLSTERLTRILSVDDANLVAEVEPGVVTGHFQRHVEGRGLFYPPDPASLAFCTLGGNVAECAGGPRAVKYGVTKDYVTGLEVVLPTGEVIHTGVKTKKGVVGYDLTKLIVGSEGTLGVVTKIIARLLPLPEARRTLLALFPRMDDATQVVADVTAAKIVPCCLEFLDNATVRCVEEHTRIGLPDDVEALLLIEVDGHSTAVAEEAETIRSICLAGGAREVRLAADAREADELWRARRAVSASMARINPVKINEDVTVPRSEIPALIRGIRTIAEARDLRNANFGHAGDGNIHVNILLERSDMEGRRRAEAAVREIFDLALGLGGTISGEHGIGIAKAPYIGSELEEANLELMKKIKKTFDPMGILNPGKIFPD